MVRSAVATNRSYKRQCSHCTLVTRERPQPRLLRALRQVHPELQDECTVVGQRPLEAENPIELLVELSGATAPVDAVEHGMRVPRAEKQADAPARRQVTPVAPVLGA